MVGNHKPLFTSLVFVCQAVFPAVLEGPEDISGYNWLSIAWFSAQLMMLYLDL